MNKKTIAALLGLCLITAPVHAEEQVPLQEMPLVDETDEPETSVSETIPEPVTITDILSGYPDSRIVSIKPLAGHVLDYLPQGVEVTYSDGTKGFEALTWSCDTYDTDADSYTFRARPLSDGTQPPDITLYVRNEFGLRVRETSKGCEITGRTDAEPVLEIPETIDGESVISISDDAFANDTSLTSLTLPKTLTDIGEYAFAGCTSLTEITLNGRLSTLGDGAFLGCPAVASLYTAADSTATQALAARVGVTPELLLVDYELEPIPELSVTPTPAPSATAGADSAPSTAASTPIPRLSDAVVIFPKLGESARTSYTGKAICPKVYVTYLGNRIDEGTDYTVTYHNNVDCGTAIVHFEGKGCFAGTSREAYFTIVATGSGQTYTGQVADTSRLPEGDAGADLPVPTATPAPDLSKATVTLAGVTNGKLSYTGSELRPAVTVACAGETFTEGADYTVTYTNNTRVGIATVVITGTGRLSGTRKVNFTIIPASGTASPEVGVAASAGTPAAGTTPAPTAATPEPLTLDGVELGYLVYDEAGEPVAYRTERLPLEGEHWGLCITAEPADGSDPRIRVTAAQLEALAELGCTQLRFVAPDAELRFPIDALPDTVPFDIETATVNSFTGEAGEAKKHTEWTAPAEWTLYLTETALPDGWNESDLLTPPYMTAVTASAELDGTPVESDVLCLLEGVSLVFPESGTPIGADTDGDEIGIDGTVSADSETDTPIRLEIPGVYAVTG